MDDSSEEERDTPEEAARKNFETSEVRTFRQLFTAASSKSHINVLHWMRDSVTPSCPTIARLARASLCMPAQSSPTERAFSNGRRVLRDDRLSLSNAHASRLITEYIRHKLSLRTEPHIGTIPKWAMPENDGTSSLAASLLKHVAGLPVSTREDICEWIADIPQVDGPGAGAADIDVSASNIDVAAAAADEDALEAAVYSSRRRRSSTSGPATLTSSRSTITTPTTATAAAEVPPNPQRTTRGRGKGRK